MRQYTDVPISLVVDGYNHTSMDDIHVTFKQGSTVIDITDVEVTAEKISLVLTQRETSQLRDQTMSVQVNFFTEEGQRKATDIVSVSVGSNLLRRILNANGS